MRPLLIIATASLSACTAASQPPPTVPPRPPCPVVSSTDWKAWVNAMPGPGARPTLNVTGMVVLPWSNWEARFTTIRVMESYPVQTVVELDFTTNSTEPKPATPVEIRGSWPSEPQVGSVTVMCNGTTLARISPVETAY